MGRDTSCCIACAGSPTEAPCCLRSSPYAALLWVLLLLPVRSWMMRWLTLPGPCPGTPTSWPGT